MQDRLSALRRTILLHQIKARQRNVKAGSLGVLKQHEFRRSISLIDFLQSLVLPDAMLHVDDVISHRQIAEVGEKCRHLRFLPLRTRRHQVRLVEQIARPEHRQVGFRQDESLWQVCLQQSCGEHFPRKI